MHISRTIMIMAIETDVVFGVISNGALYTSLLLVISSLLARLQFEKEREIYFFLLKCINPLSYHVISLSLSLILILYI